MKTIRLEIELTYDADILHGFDRESIRWFCENVLSGTGEERLILHSNEIGDEVGDVKVLKIEHVIADIVLGLTPDELANASKTT